MAARRGVRGRRGRLWCGRMGEGPLLEAECVRVSSSKPRLRSFVRVLSMLLAMLTTACTQKTDRSAHTSQPAARTLDTIIESELPFARLDVRVLDANGQPVRNAAVIVQSAEAGASPDSTDSDGWWRGEIRSYRGFPPPVSIEAEIVARRSWRDSLRGMTPAKRVHLVLDFDSSSRAVPRIDLRFSR